jgi:hypothetical protein
LDYDNDGRRDFLLTGDANSSDPGGEILHLYRNLGPGINSAPASLLVLLPTQLAVGCLLPGMQQPTLKLPRRA